MFRSIFSKKSSDSNSTKSEKISLLNNLLQKYCASSMDIKELRALWHKNFDTLSQRKKDDVSRAVIDSITRINLIAYSSIMEEIALNKMTSAYHANIFPSDIQQAIKFKLLGDIFHIHSCMIGEKPMDRYNYRSPTVVDYDDADAALRVFTTEYQKLTPEEKVHVNQLLAKQLQTSSASLTHVLIRIHEISTFDSERFPKEAATVIAARLKELITYEFDVKKRRFLDVYDEYDYHPLTLQIYSERYLAMDSTERKRETALMLDAIDPKLCQDFGFYQSRQPRSKYDIKNLEDILGFAHTIIIEGKPVENFPMAVADKICEKLYPQQQENKTLK